MTTVVLHFTAICPNGSALINFIIWQRPCCFPKLTTTSSQHSVAHKKHIRYKNPQGMHYPTSIWHYYHIISIAPWSQVTQLGAVEKFSCKQPDTWMSWKTQFHYDYKHFNAFWFHLPTPDIAVTDNVCFEKNRIDLNCLPSNTSRATDCRIL